jgi:hypothetical protein
VSQEVINGAKYAFSTILGAAVVLESISNANPAVATDAAGGESMPAAGSIVLLKSNWGDLNDIATYLSAGGVLEQIDTSNLRYFPEDESAPASLRPVSGFTSLTQIRDIQQSGGDTNTFTWGYVDSSGRRQFSRPTDQNPLVLTFILDRDVSLPWHDKLDEMSAKRQLVVMRETFVESGDVLLYTGYVAFQKSPSRVRNENMTVTAVMTVNSDILRFPADFFAGS